MSKKIFDCLVTTGSYQTDAGEKKYNNLKVGTAFQNEKGQISMKLEAIPLKVNNDDGIWINLLEKKPKEPAGATN